MTTCKTCGKEAIHLYDGLCSLCSYYSTHPQNSTPERKPLCTTDSGRSQAGEFAVITYRGQARVLVTLEGSTWMRGDEEHDSGDYATWYEPTEEEKQSAEYQQLAAELAADVAAEEAARQHAQAQTHDIDILDALLDTGDDEPTGFALTAPEPEKHEEQVEPRIAEGRVARIEVRLTQTQKDMLTVFCQKTGNHLSTFLVTSALAAMRDEIARHPSLFKMD